MCARTVDSVSAHKQTKKNITLRSSSNVNIVEWLVSMTAVQLFVGPAFSISFGFACRGYTFDRNALNVLFHKVQGLRLGCMFSFDLGFTFGV